MQAYERAKRVVPEAARIIQTCQNPGCMEARQDIVSAVFAALEAAKLTRSAKTAAKKIEMSDAARDAADGAERALRRLRDAAHPPKLEWVRIQCPGDAPKDKGVTCWAEVEAADAPQAE